MTRDLLDKILQQFASLLTKRLAAKVLTTEDSVRYTFFAALLGVTDIEAHQLIQEYPHPHSMFKNKRIDTLIDDGANRTALEFKYHRAIPSGKNTPKPQMAGKAFNDILRLAESGFDGVFVHLTDLEAAGYLGREANGLKSFFDVKRGEILQISPEFFVPKSKTFVENSGGPFSVKLKTLISVSLPDNHYLRAYLLYPDSFSI